MVSALANSSPRLDRGGRGHRPADPFDAKCPSRVILDHVTSKWGVLVVVTLARESHRFGELHQAIGGVSEKMLTQTLRSLESDGFVDRHSHGTVPPRVDYSLTPLGIELSAVLIPLVQWVGDNAATVAEAWESSDVRAG